MKMSFQENLRSSGHIERGGIYLKVNETPGEKTPITVLPTACLAKQSLRVAVSPLGELSRRDDICHDALNLHPESQE